MPETARLLDLIERVHGGDAWHGPSVMGALEGVTARMAAEHPVPGAHSIWEIVLHVTGWRREVARRARGADAADPIEGDWPSVPAPTDENWSAALERLQEAHDDLAAAVRALSPERLDATVRDERDPALGTGLSLYVTLHGIVHHDAYHGGQISLLKRALEHSARAQSKDKG